MNNNKIRIRHYSDILDYLWIYLISAGILMAILSIG